MYDENQMRKQAIFNAFGKGPQQNFGQGPMGPQFGRTMPNAIARPPMPMQGPQPAGMFARTPPTPMAGPPRPFPTLYK